MSTYRIAKVRHTCVRDVIPHLQAFHMRLQHGKYYFLPPKKWIKLPRHSALHSVPSVPSVRCGKLEILVVPIIEVPDLYAACISKVRPAPEGEVGRCTRGALSRAKSDKFSRERNALVWYYVGFAETYHTGAFLSRQK